MINPTLILGGLALTLAGGVVGWFIGLRVTAGRVAGLMIAMAHDDEAYEPHKPDDGCPGCRRFLRMVKRMQE